MLFTNFGRDDIRYVRLTFKTFKAKNADKNFRPRARAWPGCRLSLPTVDKSAVQRVTPRTFRGRCGASAGRTGMSCGGYGQGVQYVRCRIFRARLGKDALGVLEGEEIGGAVCGSRTLENVEEARADF